MLISTVKKGDTSVLIYDDYCQITSPELISNAIQRISEIVSGAYGRATSSNGIGHDEAKSQ